MAGLHSFQLFHFIDTAQPAWLVNWLLSGYELALDAPVHLRLQFLIPLTPYEEELVAFMVGLRKTK